MKNIKVILLGIGSMGSGMAKDLLKNKKGVEIVAAIGQNPAKIGKDLGEVLGLSQKTGVIYCSKRCSRRIEKHRC